VILITKNLFVQVAEQPFRGTMLYPAVGLSSAGEEVRLIDAAELWGIEPETDSDGVRVLVMFYGTFLSVF